MVSILHLLEVWRATHTILVSYAVGTSMMGATVKAGISQIDYKRDLGTDHDPSFVTVSYSIAGLNLGYGMYDRQRK